MANARGGDKMLRKIIRYCILGTFLINLSGLFSYNIFGDQERDSQTSEALPGVSKKEATDEKEECCDNKVEAANLEVKSQGLQSLPELPDVVMVDQDGKMVRFVSGLLKEKVTVINFIYTSCKSVCQILTNNFRQLENSLDGIDKNGDVQLVSISIDPEVDTPARLRQYAELQRIDLSRWTLLVGGLNSIERLSRALGFSNIDKTTHAPGVVIWDDIDKMWYRFVGITPPHIVLKQLRELPAISG